MGNSFCAIGYIHIVFNVMSLAIKLWTEWKICCICERSVYKSYNRVLDKVAFVRNVIWLSWTLATCIAIEAGFQKKCTSGIVRIKYPNNSPLHPHQMTFPALLEGQNLHRARCFLFLEENVTDGALQITQLYWSKYVWIFCMLCSMSFMSIC